jgi:hypothetical protein
VYGCGAWNIRRSEWVVAGLRLASRRSQPTIANRPVLIISTIVDVATDAVIEELSRAEIPVVRINTENFPFAGIFDYSLQSSGGPDSSLSRHTGANSGRCGTDESAFQRGRRRWIRVSTTFAFGRVEVLFLAGSLDTRAVG